MKISGDRLLWLAVGLAFTLLLAAWVTFFIIASNNPVEIVPLVRTLP